MITAGFLNFGAIDILGWVILCWCSCPVHWRVSLSIPGPYPLDASNNPLSSSDSQKCLQILLGSGAEITLLCHTRTSGLKKVVEGQEILDNQTKILSCEEPFRKEQRYSLNGL